MLNGETVVLTAIDQSLKVLSKHLKNVLAFFPNCSLLSSRKPSVQSRGVLIEMRIADCF